MAEVDTVEPRGSRKLSNLGMVWHHATRYPLQIVLALVALVAAAGATLFFPATFKQIVDNGFAQHASTAAVAPYFPPLILVVLVLALATATRFYCVSWLGERTVADIRVAVHRNLLRMSPGFFEENRPAEITSRITVDTTII